MKKKKLLLLLLTLIVFISSVSCAKESSTLIPSMVLKPSIIPITTVSSIKSISVDKEEHQQNPFEKGYNDYEGEINHNIKIYMSIYPNGINIVGTYFYEKIRKKIQLKGKVDSNQIILNEYDMNGENTGIFKGTTNANDEFIGTWSSPDSRKHYTFKLSLVSIINDEEYGHRYRGAGFDDDKEVEKFVENLQFYIKNNNKEMVASLINYPISVHINGQDVVIKTKTDFVRKYNSIFNPDYKKIMVNAFTKYLFGNWRGIMFGGDMENMWINNVMKPHKLEILITTINN